MVEYGAAAGVEIVTGRHEPGRGVAGDTAGLVGDAGAGVGCNIQPGFGVHFVGKAFYPLVA